MALVATFTPRLDGTPPTYGAAAAGDTVKVGDVLVVKNGSASSINVTFATPGALATGDDYPDKVYAVAAGAERWIPVLPAYADPTDRLAHITWSATATVTRAAIHAP